MEIYQLKVFLQVARYLSFTEAARSLNLTQPAVSAKIKSLEADIGAPLFHRLGRAVKLTEMGEFLLEGAQDLVDREAALNRELEHYQKGCKGELKIACSPAVAVGYIANPLVQFREQNPEIDIDLRIANTSQDLYHSLTSSEVDVGISEVSFIDSQEIHCQPIASIQYTVLSAPTNPWAMRDRLSLSEVASERWVLNRQDPISQSVFAQRLADIGLEIGQLEAVEIADNEALMKAYIQSGRYLGFASTLCFQAEIQATQLCALPLHEFPLPSPIFVAFPSRTIDTLKASARAVGKRSQSEAPVQKLLALLDSKFPGQTRAVVSAPSRDSILIPVMDAPAHTTSIRTIEKTETLPIRIGVQNKTLPSVSGGIVMQKLGLLNHYLPKTGRYASSQFDVRWQDSSTGMPIVDGLHGGQLDLGILGDYPMLLSAQRNRERVDGENSTILIGFVAVNPDGCRNAVIVPQHSAVNEIGDLRGQALAIPNGSAAHGMVLRVLHQHGLSADVELVPVQNNPKISKANRNIADRDIAAYAHFSPFHELALERNQFRYLFDGNVSGLPAFYGVVARKGFADEHPDLVVSYLRGLVAAQYWQATVPNSSQKLSQWTHSSPRIIDSILGTSPTQDSQGLYFLDTHIRTDWIVEHVNHYQSATDDCQFASLNLDHWIDTDFMVAAVKN
ncbi:MAG: LysR substrate-binding domain-containing protein [Cyanobacteria bacterium J06597_1]